MPFEMFRILYGYNPELKLYWNGKANSFFCYTLKTNKDKTSKAKYDAITTMFHW